MFFLVEDERVISLHPSFFGNNIRTYLMNQLYKDIEGTLVNGYFVIAVMDKVEISEGRVIPGAGGAEYTMHYRALVWRPFKGEILDGVVGNVLDSGFFVEIGPLNTFVAKHQINRDFKFDGNSTPPQWVNDAENEVVAKGGQVRIKVIGIRTEVETMYAIGAMNDDYLGPLNGPDT